MSRTYLTSLGGGKDCNSDIFYYVALYVVKFDICKYVRLETAVNCRVFGGKKEQVWVT